MLYALMRGISPAMAECELTFLDRVEIDARLAEEQHRTYQQRLEDLGLRVILIPADPSLQDAPFVEDMAVVLDELAVITHPGALSRRPEATAVAEVLSRFRPLQSIAAPATLEGGDVMRVGRKLFVGLSSRTSRDGIDQLRSMTAPHGYQVVPVPVTGCLHLKTGGTWLGDDTWLVNRHWIETSALRGYRLLDVPADEPWAANTLRIGDTLFMPDGVPRTRAMLNRLGYQTTTLEIGELQKAEAGLTCMSVIFEV